MGGHDQTKEGSKEGSMARHAEHDRFDIVAAHVCRRRRILARALLGVGGLALIAVAVILGGLRGGETGLDASLLYLAPAALALVAAVLIEPA